MHRREALKSIVGTLATASVSFGQTESAENVKYFGAIKPSTHTMRQVFARPKGSFYDRFGVFRGISQQVDEVFLYKHLEKEIGRLIPHYQGPDPETGDPGEGDCVAQAAGIGSDILAGVNIHMLGKREKFIAKASVEMLYTGSRVEIGGNQLLTGGSNGIWMVQFLQKYGVLHRLEYRLGDNYIDLRGYHPGRSRQYRNKGVPDWLEDTAREHPVLEYTQVKSGTEALDAVCAGQVVLMCSTYAFYDKRDDDGFTMPKLDRDFLRGRRRFVSRREQWWHCMLLAAKVLKRGREGGTILNSHGKWNSGPQPDDMPDGSFNVETQYLDLMVKDWYDCYALSLYKGHEAAKIRHRLY